MLLSIVTGCETVFVSGMTADLETYSVLHAEGALVLVTFCLWIAALNTTLSVNFMRNFIVAIFAALFLQVIFLVYMIFGQPNFWMTLGYLSLMIFVTGAYILIDLVYIMSGTMNKDDYIWGALMLYVDLIRMFIYILAIVGEKK